MQNSQNLVFSYSLVPTQYVPTIPQFVIQFPILSQAQFSPVQKGQSLYEALETKCFKTRIIGRQASPLKSNLSSDNACTHILKVFFGVQKGDWQDFQLPAEWSSSSTFLVKFKINVPCQTGGDWHAFLAASQMAGKLQFLVKFKN